ncbi:NPC1-like intracellular cholesterol transporter 1 isoform X2 [Gallus gallus]|uniref:NPC1-like intracellular cholesterol transporter 1 isoform X2 n=1 Tax=Gallus gallus TaxID=9031 RepID=UPI001AE48F23|nr:NPC1-like intracellular cholesterol transporter 1 isoform X2 [Gallus gallus]
MLQYFSDMERFLQVGVPTYFVTTSGYDFATAEGTDAVCSSAGCANNSLTQTIQYATRFPNVSFLAIPATSWVDDFLDWLNPTGRCCRTHRYGELSGQFCPSTSTAPGCVRCLNATRRPSEAEFRRFLPWFLRDRPTLECAKGGLGAYDTAVSMDENGTILASRFMAYQRPLRTSQEFTAALKAHRALAAEITAALRRVPGTAPDFRVFPYTVTYVYYEQYLTVVAEGLLTVALCVAPTFAVSFVLLGMDLRCSAASVVTIAMILLDTAGLMALWDIPYKRRGAHQPRGGCGDLGGIRVPSDGGVRAQPPPHTRGARSRGHHQHGQQGVGGSGADEPPRGGGVGVRQSAADPHLLLPPQLRHHCARSGARRRLSARPPQLRRAATAQHGGLRVRHGEHQIRHREHQIRHREHQIRHGGLRIRHGGHQSWHTEHQIGHTEHQIGHRGHQIGHRGH